LQKWAFGQPARPDKNGLNVGGFDGLNYLKLEGLNLIGMNATLV
jgi:hypothetical protein